MAIDKGTLYVGIVAVVAIISMFLMNNTYLDNGSYLNDGTPVISEKYHITERITEKNLGGKATTTSYTDKSTIIKKKSSEPATIIPLSLIKGDLNGDNKADYKDAELIAAYIEGKITLREAEFRAADMDDDSKITEKDKKLLLSYIKRT